MSNQPIIDFRLKKNTPFNTIIPGLWGMVRITNSKENSVVIEAQNGCRLPGFYLGPTTRLYEYKKAKKYEIIYKSVSGAHIILFRYSIRDIEKPTDQWPILKITIGDWSQMLKCKRPEKKDKSLIPYDLDVQVNRYLTAIKFLEAKEHRKT